MLPLALLAFSLVVVMVEGASIASATWRKPTFANVNGARTHQAFAALFQAVAVFRPNQVYVGPPYEQLAHVLGQMAEQEVVGNTTTYQEPIVGFMGDALRVRAAFGNTGVDFALAWGYSAARAHFTLNNAQLLGYAVQCWEWANTYTISPGTNRLASKAPSISTSCATGPLTGGTFATSTLSSPTLSARATGYFALLSAMLAQATSNTTYLDAAVASVSFIRTHLWDAPRGLPMAALAADSCAVTDTSLQSNNAALLVEALSVLSVITGGDARVGGLLDGLVTKVLEYDGWQTAQGILASGDTKVGDGLLVRALTWAYLYNATNSGNRGYIHDYVAVQYNAVTDLATYNLTAPPVNSTNPASNLYAAQWTGPPPAPGTNVSFANQTNAIHVLYAAAWIDFPGSPVPPPLAASLRLGEGVLTFGAGTSGDKDGNTGAHQSKAASHTGAITGGIVGAVAALAALCALLLVCHHRRRAARRGPRDSGPAVPRPTPPSPTSAGATGPSTASLHSRGYSQTTTSLTTPSSASATLSLGGYQDMNQRPVSGSTSKSGGSADVTVPLVPVRRREAGEPRQQLTQAQQRRGVSFGGDFDDPPPEYA
ncbi:Glycoside hydrolase family 76 protein [Mycena indigotica]|uniref:Glycoside hydrolase family 76 protein n=1 Tax=Mycena indigotica TaxID=2126181 RepID=A0A8H6SRJ9_9AGAR|nr:Glycoside hydrolase family 76 protein [Mycena indigotica]KAF7304114.1 Glycoside hydrolase family 76 protein [Mycena indigotica]